jgi:hypothetical protein
MFSWYNKNLIVKKSPKGGYGVFATNVIRKTEMVARFGGYVMTLAEEQQLPESIRDNAHQIDDNFVLGVKSESEMTVAERFNHSCDPNCGFKGQIFLVAMKDIGDGEEVTFDYAMVLGGNVEYEIKCLCESRVCRGYIRGHDWKIPELQTKYAGYFQWYIQEKIDKLN